MSRIFSVLALLSALFLTATVVLGLQTGDYNRSASRFREAVQGVNDDENDQDRNDRINQLYAELAPSQAAAGQHRLTAIFASLAVIFVNCVSVTYFIGTNRWGQEVVEAYKLDVAYSERIRQLKRNAFPWSLLSVVMVMVTASFGAAADPATGRSGTAFWVTPHLCLGLGTLAIVIWSFLNQVITIKHNTDVTQEIEAEVRRIRQQHGLDVEVSKAG